jgi:hypothetical protein
MAKLPTPKTAAALAYHKRHRWLLNGNIPGYSKEHYAMIEQLNKGK